MLYKILNIRVLLGVLTLVSSIGFAQVSITAGSTTYSNDFTGFDGSTDPTDWITEDVQSTSVWRGTGTGTSTTGGKYSFGIGSGVNFEGSLGFLPSSNRSINAIISFTNNTNSEITSFDIKYTAEHWRSASGGRENGWEVSYKIENDAPINMPNLTYIAPNDIATGGGIHGSENKTTTIMASIPSGQTIDIIFFGDNGTGSGSRQGVAIDDFEISFSTDAIPGIDKDSQVTAPSSGQVAAGNIVADISDNVSNSVEIFKFDISDLGTSDGLATEITQLHFIPGPSNTASWSENIEGLSIISSGNGGILAQNNQNLILSDTEIIVEILDNSDTEMTIPDGTTQEYTVKVFLKSSGIQDNQVIQFEITTSTASWQTASGSSELQSSFSGVIGNPFTIEVIGDSYEFINQPRQAVVNQPMSTNVQLAYVDNNNNYDKSFSGQVELTSSGTLLNAPLLVNVTDGIATYNGLDIIHSVAENNRTLTATSSAFPSGITSAFFDIISTPELFITEIADPGGDGEANAKYVEIYNAGVNTINLDETNYFLTREANAGNNYEINQITGTLAPKSYYIVSQLTASEFQSQYGTNSNVEANILGNGNDTYILSTLGTTSDDAINSLFDVYGEIGINAFTSDDSDDSINDNTADDTAWEYEDSRAYRKNPTVKNANSVWTESEWVIEPAEISDMTPGYGDNDYIYDGSWLDLNTGLGNLGNPDGVSLSSENIFIRSGETTLTSDTTIGDLVVRDAAILRLAAGIKLTITGDIVNEGSIVFESDANGSAVLEAVQPASRVSGDGFEIHRYIPDSNRAFRYLSPSVTTTTSIKDNWQEGQNNTSLTSNSNTNPGFGTHITGSKTGDNGFDATETGNPSMFEFNENTQEWNPVPNTDTKTFNAGEAYAILIRGDRSSPLNSNFDMGPATTLRTTGIMRVGDYSVASLPSTIDKFVLIGNPYQSQIDLKNLMDNHAEELDNNKVYIYDPTLGDRGAYATIDLSNLNFSSVPSGTSANQFLQPNQAFFVQSTGSNPALIFSESTKDNGGLQTSTFSTQNMMPNHINVNLKNNNEKLIDGVRLVFDDSHNLKVDNYDAVKFWNLDESISIYSHNKNLSIEKRPQPSVTDTTQLHLYNHTKPNYKLEAEYITNTTDNNNVYLLDQYTQDKISLLENQLVSYAFRVNTSIPETTAKDRFLIVYDSKTLSVNNSNQNDFALYPNPADSNEFNIISTHSRIENLKQIELYNSFGKLISVYNSSDLNTKQQPIRISVKENLSDGLYIVKMAFNRYDKHLKLIVKSSQ